MLVATARLNDRQGRVIKLKIDGVLREAPELWDLLSSGTETLVARFPDGREQSVEAVDPNGSRFLRTPPDGDDSNNLEALPVASFNVLVLGDSISWGQGLRKEQKISSLMTEEIRRVNGDAVATIVNYARSGSVLTSGLTPPPIRLDFNLENERGEVPNTNVSVNKQIDDFLAQGHDPLKVDFLQLCAGINDVGLSNILTYLDNRSAIIPQVASHIASPMTSLLNRCLQLFANARIFVLGYYTIISEKSFPRTPDEVDAAVGILTETRPSPHSVFTDTARRNVIANCRAFTVSSRDTIQGVVDGVNAGQRIRVFFVDPDFAPRHCLFTPLRTSLLFGLTIGMTTTDPMRSARTELCGVVHAANDADTLFRRKNCNLAAVGHPKPEGAKRYFNAMKPFL